MAGVSDAPKPPPGRVSLTLATLTAARARAARQRAREGPGSGRRSERRTLTPASLLARERLTVVASQDALPQAPPRPS